MINRKPSNHKIIQHSLFGGVYQGKRILITGHTGFKGSWLALWLHALGAQVIGLSLPPNTEPNHFDLIGLKDLIHHCIGDIRNLPTVQATFATAQPEIVFHLAAQPIVRESYDDPKTTFDTNIGGTVNVLEAIRHCPSVKAVVVVTSDKCYENKEWVWGYRENDPMGGHDPYSASKGAVEIVCSAYLRSFFQISGRGPHIGFATSRAGNVIGGGDWAKDRIIPDCVRALSVDEPIIVRNPCAVRPWQHVLEPLSGYLFLGQKLIVNPEKFSGAWNFGPLGDDSIKVGELVSRFIKVWGKGEVHTPEMLDAPHEAHMLRLVIDKAVHELKWFPVLNGLEAIDWTVEWYKAWHGGNKELQRFSLNQIAAYTGIASKKNAEWTKSSN
ncbi:MAG TPA: CDP-glucose 4,6-dehydratase [Syntrophorhabdaceae bacterium]|nr:CDP-glucose 4,6-dehydratase [Syntrophorhabdaceae bacterium]